MSSGNLEIRVFFLGLHIRTEVTPSGAEPLFQLAEMPTHAATQILVYERSLLQPRRGANQNSRILSLTREICSSTNFKTISMQKRAELRTFVEAGRLSELEAFYKEFYRKALPEIN